MWILINLYLEFAAFKLNSNLVDIFYVKATLCKNWPYKLLSLRGKNIKPDAQLDITTT